VTNTRTARLPPWSLAIAAMLAAQLSAALAVHVIAEVGAAATAWLRLTAGALIILVVARPPVREVRRKDLPALVGLGIASGFMGLTFLAAIARIPLGTTVAIEFLGPLTVAAVRSRDKKALLWPILALVGVVLVTEPWHGAIDPVGVAFALGAAAGWAAYIVLTQRVGDRFGGIRGLTMTVPIAAASTAVVGVPEAAGHLTLGVIAACVGLALLFPIFTFALEMLALRGMTYNAFGTLMALEPACASLMGLLVLMQKPSLLQLAGIVLVIVAGAAAQRGGRRDSQDGDEEALPYPPQ
jgi:inner membrane transporter RhtA